jgi:hypothetical protein
VRPVSSWGFIETISRWASTKWVDNEESVRRSCAIAAHSPFTASSMFRCMTVRKLRPLLVWKGLSQDINGSEPFDIVNAARGARTSRVCGAWALFLTLGCVSPATAENSLCAYPLHAGWPLLSRGVKSGDHGNPLS